MFVAKNDDGKNDHRSYKSIYFNYFLISYYRVRLFLTMQVRVMAACMESQSIIRKHSLGQGTEEGIRCLCNTLSWQNWYFCFSNNLKLLRCIEFKFISLITAFYLFSVLSNTIMSTIPTLCS